MAIYSGNRYCFILFQILKELITYTLSSKRTHGFCASSRITLLSKMDNGSLLSGFCLQMHCKTKLSRPVVHYLAG